MYDETKYWTPRFSSQNEREKIPLGGSLGGYSLPELNYKSIGHSGKSERGPLEKAGHITIDIQHIFSYVRNIFVEPVIIRRRFHSTIMEYCWAAFHYEIDLMQRSTQLLRALTHFRLKMGSQDYNSAFFGSFSYNLFPY